MKREKNIFKNYPIMLAGRTWVFNKVSFVKDLEGDISLPMDELDKMHKAIANALCQEETELKKEEMEFLCELSSSAWNEIAEFLYCDPSTVSKWRKKNTLPKLESICLKEFFWAKLFGEFTLIKGIEHKTIGSLSQAKMAAAAIEKKLAIHVSSSKSAA